MPKNKNAPLRKDFTYCKWVTKGSVTGPKTLSDLDDILCQILSNIVQKNENVVFKFLRESNNRSPQQLRFDGTLGSSGP